MSRSASFGRGIADVGDAFKPAEAEEADQFGVGSALFECNEIEVGLV